MNKMVRHAQHHCPQCGNFLHSLVYQKYANNNHYTYIRTNTYYCKVCDAYFGEKAKEILPIQSIIDERVNYIAKLEQELKAAKGEN